MDGVFLARPDGSPFDSRSLRVEVNGVEIVPRQASASDGTFLVVANGLSRGKHSIVVRAEDEDGKQAKPARAVAWVDPAEVRREMLRMAGGAATYFRVSSTPVPAQTTMQVGKTGRTTELTTGQSVDLAASISISYPRVGLAYFQDQIAIRDLNATAFSQPGDSGSLIWTDDPQRSPVGLLFGGGAGRTFANHIDQVLTALDIRLYT